MRRALTRPVSADVPGGNNLWESGMRVSWQAKWIWCQGEQSPRNFRMNARCEFGVPRGAKSARLHITADSRYRLFLNGAWIGDGPARSFPHRQQFDTYDVTAQMAPGKNVVAVHVWHYGESTFHYIHGRGGLLCQVEAVTGKGAKVVAATGGSWRVLPDKAFEQRTARISCQMPFEEQFDARGEETRWTRLGFDDARWRKAVVVGPVGTLPWKQLQPRTISFFTRDECYPVRVLGARFVRRPSLVSSVYARPYLYPGHTDMNMQQFRGVAVTNIRSPRRQQGRFMPALSITWGKQYYLNGKALGDVAAKGTKVTLRKGDNLLVADVSGGTHGLDIAIVMDAPGALKQEAPGAKGSQWLFVGPFDDADEKELQAARKIRTIADLQRFKRWLKPSHRRDEHAADVFSETSNQVTLDGAPRISNPDGLVSSGEDVTVVAPGKKDVEILLDFGRELVGYTQFELDAPAGVVIDFNCFEAVLKNGENQWTSGNRSSFRYVTRAGSQHFTSTWRRGYRYAAMTLRNVTAPVRIRRVRTLLATYPAVERGRFHCSDALLNKIWEVGRHTLRCCMEDTFTDCPTYEQTFWVGDARNEALICHAAFGAYELTDRCARLAADSMCRSPLVESQVPSGWQDILTAWSLLWVMLVEEHHTYSGDDAFLRKLYPSVSRMLKKVKDYCDNEWGLLSIDTWNMFDWTATDTNCKLVTHNSLFLVGALDCAHRMAEKLDKKGDMECWRAFRGEIVRNVNKHLWSDASQAYIDSIHDDGTPSAVISQPTNSLALLYGVAPPKRAEAISELVVNPPEGVVPFGSPFAMFYLLEELARAGRFDELLALVRDKWGFMIEWGATTFWETFAGRFLSWVTAAAPTRSHCHAWSAAPTYFMSRYLLGVSPLEPGFKRALVAPNPVDLAWCEGEMPTPAGGVCVNWRRSPDEFRLMVTPPEGIAVEVVLPVSAKAFPKLVINGAEASARRRPRGVSRITRMKDAFRIEARSGVALEVVASKR